MKETKKSLKAYFIIVGILGILSGSIEIFSNFDLFLATNFLIKAINIIAFIPSIIFIFCGFKLYNYLQTSPKTIIILILISLSSHAFLGLLIRQSIIISLLLIPFYILFGWYLINNVKKLSIQSNIIDS